MKKIIFFLLVISNTSFSQEAFVKKIATNLDEFAIVEAFIPNKGYILSVAKKVSGAYKYSNLLYKTDLNGNILDSLEFDESEYDIGMIRLLPKKTNYMFYGDLTSTDYNLFPLGFILGEITSELEILWDTLLLQEDSVGIRSVILDSKGELIVLGNILKINNPIYNNIWVYDTNANFINHNSFNLQDNFESLVDIPTKNTYHILTHLAQGSIHEVSYDLSYNGKVYNFYPADTFLFYDNPHPITDSTYAVVASYKEFTLNGFRDIALNIFNQNGNRINSYIIGRPDTYDIGRFASSCYSDTIFIAGHVNYPAGVENFTPADSWIGVASVNYQCEPNWEIFFGGDGRYLITDILATHDGGCLIAATYWDWENNPEFERDIILIKINENGSWVSTHNPNISAKEAIVFPNPGKNNLNIKIAVQHRQSHFFLYDINGKLLLEEQINGTAESINTSNLQNGTYIYKILNDKGLYETGKWIKN